MLHLLNRHPVPIAAFFRHSLVLTFAYPQELLQPLLPPGLVLDTYRGFGFLAIAMVQTVNLRPSFLPEFLGQDFFLCGYRIFSRLDTPGSSIRGLRILRSDTDKLSMVLCGNVLTHYDYRLCKAECDEDDAKLRIAISTPRGDADLEVLADLAQKPAPLPEGTPFENAADARRFAGPLPYTFDYEAHTGSIIMIRGVRQHWDPQAVRVDLRKCSFLKSPPFCEAPAVLANAFHLQDVPYRWERGVRRSVRSNERDCTECLRQVRRRLSNRSI
jgi:hypothetical protein